MKPEDVLKLRASGHVQRCHTFQHIGSYSVAEHCAQALHLLFCLHPNPSQTLVKAVLWHDHAERLCGDVPAPVKRKNPELASAHADAEIVFFAEYKLLDEAMFGLTEEELRWLKAIDTLELMLWAEDQILLGNRHAENIAVRARGYLTEDVPHEVSTFLAHLDMYEWRSFV